MYEDSISKKIIDTWEPQASPKLKGHWYNGDIVLPAKSDLPLVYVARDVIEDTPDSNMEQQHLISMVANVIYDFTTDLQQSYDMVAGASGLYELMEARDAQYRLKPNSLLFLAEKYVQLDTKLFIAVGSPITINYGLGVERRGPGIFSTEAVMRFTVRLQTPRAGLY